MAICKSISLLLSSKGCWVTASQSSLPSLAPLFVAGWIRLQMGAAHRATYVALLKTVGNLPHKRV